MSESIELSTIIPTTAERIYRAWLDGKQHGAFTGGKATVEPKVGGRFSAWDGYIWGTNLELVPFQRIVQAWRTNDFSPESEDSRLEIVLEEVEDGTKISLFHSNIPVGQGHECYQGWIEYYFKPMKEFFFNVDK